MGAHLGSDRRRGRGTRLKRSARVVVACALLALAAAVAATTAARAAPARSASRVWQIVASRMFAADRADAEHAHALAVANSYALTSPAERRAAQDAANADLRDAKDTARGRFRARLKLAADLHESDIYRVAIDPAHFTSTVDNPLFPLAPGSVATYRTQTEEGVEIDEVTVLAATKAILGVPCVTVHDVVKLDDVVTEDTLDYYAQDVDGNVWYFGESSLSYENGRLTSIEGSWEAGAEGAQPGIIMRATPVVGDAFRQEFQLGVAEDYARVLSLNETATVPAGTYTGCVQTFEGTPIEPDSTSQKFYSRGIGVVLEVELDTGDRVELTSFTTN